MIDYMEKLYTQEDLVETLRRRGYDLRVRTLTYWRSQELIGDLWRNGNDYYVTREDIAKVVELCKARRPELLKLEMEGKKFSIERVVMTSFEGELVIRLYTRDMGMLVRVLKEEEKIDQLRSIILNG